MLENLITMAWVQFYKVDQSVLTTYLEATGNRDSLVEFLKLPGVPYKYIDGMIYFRQKELAALRKKLSRNPLKLARRALPLCIKVADAFVDACKKISSSDYRRKGNAELKELYLDFCRAWKDLLGLATIPLFFEDIIEGMLQSRLKKFAKGKSYEHSIKVLTNLATDTFGIKEKKDMYKIACYIFNKKIRDFEKNREVKEMVRRHLQKWGWIKKHILLGGGMRQSELISRIRHSLEKNPVEELSKINNEKKRFKREYAKIIQKWPSIRALADTAQQIIYVRDYRFAKACQGCYIIKDFLRECASRFSMGYDEFIALTPKEAGKLFEGKRSIKREILRERLKAYALVVEGKKEIIAVKGGFRKIMEEEKKKLANVKDFAGVMFTLDPIRKKYVLVEVAAGLGEKVVSGSVTPSSFMLDKKTLKIVEKNVSYKVSDATIKKIAKIGLQIEKHYKKPQDVEFAVKRGKIFVLQSRAITTL
jgi:hypothetical protein